MRPRWLANTFLRSAVGKSRVKNRVCEVGGGGAHMGVYFSVAGPLKTVRELSMHPRILPFGEWTGRETFIP